MSEEEKPTTGSIDADNFAPGWIGPFPGEMPDEPEPQCLDFCPRCGAYFACPHCIDHDAAQLRYIPPDGTTLAQYNKNRRRQASLNDDDGSVARRPQLESG
jgi:hypothetical protein